MTSLLQEIISVYTLLNPSQLTAAASNRVCNALALLQCVASHNDTRTLFLNGEQKNIPYSTGARPLTRCPYSPYSSLPVSFPEHDFEIPAFRVSPPYEPRRDRRAG
jgi:CCR4-NOT transcription complex subunit 9